MKLSIALSPSNAGCHAATTQSAIRMSEHAAIRTGIARRFATITRRSAWSVATVVRPGPTDGEQWTQYVRDVAASVPGDWFEDLGGAIAPVGAARSRLSASAGGKGVVVTTDSSRVSSVAR